MAGVALLALGWLWWRVCFPFGAVGAAAVCVAGVALGDIDRHFAWQAWHLATWIMWIVTLHGGRGAYGTGLALVARLVPVWRRGRRSCLRGRRGTWRHRSSLCVAGLALGDMDRHFAWQAWRLWHWAGSGGALGSRLAPWAPRLFAWQAWHLATSTVTLRGRPGTWRHRSSLCKCGTYGTGLALVARLVPVWRRGRRGCLCGRRGTGRYVLRCRRMQAWHTDTWRHRPSFGLAGVALGDIHAVSEFISLKYNFVTHNFVTRNLSHLALTCNFIAHNFVKHNSFAHNFSRTSLSHATLSPTTLSHT